MTDNLGSGLPDDAVWIDDQEDYIDDNPIGLGDLRSDAEQLADAREVFAHETAAESASVFEDKGETAGEAAAAFEPSLTDRVVDAIGPAIATVLSKAAPVVAQAAQAMAPAVAAAEKAAKPVVDQAATLAKPVIERAEKVIKPAVAAAEPYVERATEQLSGLADRAADQADKAAELLDVAAERVKDTAVGFVEVAKPIARDVAAKVKSAVGRSDKE